jgi:NAD(P)H-dependent FMN reductase
MDKPEIFTRQHNTMILGICGSPRKMATEYVLGEALKMLEEQGFQTMLFSMRGKNIAPCKHCDYCLKNKECIVQDDMYELYPLFEKAKGFVIATPVYNGSLSAQTKVVIDRTRATLAADPKALRGKPGMAIPIGGGFFGANLGATFWSKDTLDGVKEDTEGFRSLGKTVKKFVQALPIESKVEKQV